MKDYLYKEFTAYFEMENGNRSMFGGKDKTLEYIFDEIYSFADNKRILHMAIWDKHLNDEEIVKVLGLKSGSHIMLYKEFDTTEQK